MSKERAEKNNKKLPSISKMLQQLETGETPAHHTILQLIKFKEISWDALNSYVHSGLHAVNRNMNGYPAELVFPVIRQSNNLMYMASYLLAILTGSSLIVEQVKLTKQNFLDCLQID